MSVQGKDEEDDAMMRGEEDRQFVFNLARHLGADPKHIVSEIYSPHRVTGTAKRYPNICILLGFALDLSTQDETGTP